MKIDKNKPLPDHTKLHYDECCALLVLKELFPDRYSKLEISDKPDLQGVNVGVEVTIADDRNHQEALNNWVKAYHCDDEKKRENYIECMKQLGVTYTGGIQAWPGQVPSLKYVKESIHAKIKKLKTGNYKRFLNDELFIFTDTWMHKTLLNEVEKFLADNKVFEFFSRVYILEQGSNLHIFEENYYKKVIIDVSEQTDRNIRARRIVEQAEEQE